MNPRDSHKLLGGYATGTLTRSEREVLMRAALEDDRIFEELAEEEDLRVALADEPFRAQLASRLRLLRPEVREDWAFRLPRLMSRVYFGWFSLAGVVAGLIVIVLIRQGAIQETSPVAGLALGPGTIPALHMAGILETPGAAEKEIESRSRTEPPSAARNASLAVDRAGDTPVYAVGDRMRIGFNVMTAANVLLIEERPDGSARRLFPNRFQSSPGVAAKQAILVPPAGQGDLEVDGPTDVRTLRLLVFPADVDPLAPDADWNRVRTQARVIQKQYEVR